MQLDSLAANVFCFIVKHPPSKIGQSKRFYVSSEMDAAVSIFLVFFIFLVYLRYYWKN